MTDVFLQQDAVPRTHKEAQNGHRGTIVWFTGLPRAGKSTLAYSVENKLHQMGCRTFVLDGDDLRSGLCADLGFSAYERTENIRRVAEVAKLFLDGGVIVLVALISPFRKDRDRVRSMFSFVDFMEIYCQCPIEVCEMRDVKGLYRKARAGLIADFTGVSQPYEAPEHPELVINTAESDVDKCATHIVDNLCQRGIVGKQ